MQTSKNPAETMRADMRELKLDNEIKKTESAHEEEFWEISGSSCVAGLEDRSVQTQRKCSPPLLSL